MDNLRPTIAFYGSSLVSAYWNGAATYYRGIIRALHELGYAVTFYEPDAYQRQAHRDMDDPDWARVVVYPATEAGVAAALQAGLEEADILVKASGVGVFDEWLEAALVREHHPHQRTIFWDVDAPATLSRMDDDPEDAFRRALPQYDLVLTYGGGDPVVQRYQALGARRCIPIYNALDTTTHYPVPPEERFRADLAFLGNRLPDREARVEEFFFKPARLLPDHQFLIGGSGWEDAALPPNVRHVGHVYTADHNAFNCSATAVLNINRESMAANGFSPATRVFEAAGAGACLITDDFVGLDEFLTPGQEVLAARSGEAVAQQLAALDPGQAAAIGRAARERVGAEHTYRHRARQLDGILQPLFQSTFVN